MEDPTSPPAILTSGELTAVNQETVENCQNGIVDYSSSQNGQVTVVPAQILPGTPPQQQQSIPQYVVGPDMHQLENQFQQMGMAATVPVEPSKSLGTTPQPASQRTSTTEATDNDEETQATDEDPLKLFVGQVPKTLGEEDIFTIFEPFGPLKDLAIIRDKHTGLHRGCAFVTYWSSQDAERAQQALHDCFTFPGGRRPAQVKPAEPSAVPENKLFIGMLSRKAGEEDVRELFSPFGEIREIYMIRNADGSSKCAAFLRYVDREAALKAIEGLNHLIVMDGATRPLIVKFADNKQQRQARQMRNTRRDHMMAAAAMRAQPPLNFPYPPPHQMPPVPGPLGVPPEYQIPQAHHYPVPGPPPPQQQPFGAGSPPHHAYAMYPPPPPHHLMGYAPFAQQLPPQMQQQQRSAQRPREGPAGANLFVYHLPHDLTDADLATAFNPFGNVISAKVYVDRNTGESKGFGFVSYDSVISAEQAIEQMNGFQIGNKRLKVQHKRVNTMMHHHPM